MFAAKPGTRYFLEKNMPLTPLPSRETLARGASYNVYDALRKKMEEELQTVQGQTLCVMFDCWSDKY